MSMDITFVLGGFTRSGGARVISNVTNGLVERGHNVTIVTIDGGGGSYPLKAKCRLIRHIRPPFFLLKPLTFSANILNLAREIPESDVIVATFCWTAYSTLIAHTLGKRGVPFYYVQCYEPLMFANNPILHVMAKMTYFFPNNLISNSTWTQNILKMNFSKNSFLVRPGVNLQVFYPRNTKAKRKKVKRILWLGTDAPWKGFYDAYAAMRIASKIRGDVEFIVNWLPPNFNARGVLMRNVGFIYDDEKLADLYSSCDVFLFSSWFEGFGFPPLEAMACGLPVVTTACGGVNDFAENNVNALIVPPRDPKVAAKAVLRLLSDDSLNEHIREEGLKTAKNFTWSKAIDKVEKIFLKCTG